MTFLADKKEHIKNVRVISKTKIASEGAGQIIVDNKTAFIAHMVNEGITIVDVKDPLAPRVLSKVASAPLMSHSHKVQVSGNIMIANNEKQPRKDPWKAGIRIYDISDLCNPKEISFLDTGMEGVHRMWFVDGRYAHITAQQEGFTDNIYVIVDLKDPAKPEIISRLWRLTSD